MPSQPVSLTIKYLVKSPIIPCKYLQFLITDSLVSIFHRHAWPSIGLLWKYKSNLMGEIFDTYFLNYTCITIHRIDRGKWGTESEVHTVPHTRQTAGPADQSSGVGTAADLGSASLSVWPGEEACGLCITLPCCACVLREKERIGNRG